ncbi:MAG: M20/M25/M40 family metallo-hydrolase [Gammaproteobacteria bacterium]|nr:M20/M25/M40 family metallo-hydrolase [Gammaproteobacteria bacterium]
MPNSRPRSRRILQAAATLAALVASLARADAPPPNLPGPMPPAANQRLARDIFRDLVQIRSVHTVGTAGTAKVLVGYFKAHGFTDSEIRVLPETKYPWQVNVVVRLEGKDRGRKPVMWIAHMDVVDAKAADWTLPPFKFTERDGWFYGRGTSDMKDGDAAVAASLIRLKQEGYRPDRDLVAAFTADEEVGLEQSGPAFLLKAHPHAFSAGLVINPDGNSGELIDGKRVDFAVETVQKSYVTFTATVTNKGGHSSEPRPDNAIYELAHALVRVEGYQFPFATNATTRMYFADLAKRESGQRKADLLAVAASPTVDQAAARRLAENVDLNAILHSTCVATMLRAGVQENALPSRAVATIQCRIMPDETVAGTEARLAKAIDDSKVVLAPLGNYERAGESPPDPRLFAKVQKVVDSMWPGVPVVPVMSAGASDSIFTRNAGMPSYGIGGGWNDLADIRMHGRDERMSQQGFYEEVEFTYRLMKELTGGRP